MSGHTTLKRRKTVLVLLALLAFSGATGYLLLFRQPVSATPPPPPPTYTLTIERSGDGGEVTANPPSSSVKISTFPWTHAYQPGTVVRVMGYCSNTWEFVDWEGPVNEEDHYETVKMDADKTITADFVQATVQITGADICNDSIGIQLGGTGLIGLLVVTLNAAASSHDIYEHMVSTGSHTIPFGWGGVPVGVEYTGISATWVCDAHTPSNYDCHFKNLGYYRQSQYNIPNESDQTCTTADESVCFTNSSCAYSTGTLHSIFARQVTMNGTGTSIHHGTVNWEQWCPNVRDEHTGELLYPLPGYCDEFRTYREFANPHAASCGGGLGNDTVAKHPSNNDLACGDTVCIIGIGTKTVTDQLNKPNPHQLDNFTDSVACTGITDLVDDPPGAITIKLYP